MNKTRKNKVIVLFSVIALLMVVAAVIIFRVQGKKSFEEVPLNRLKNTKIYVDFVNSKRIHFNVFFPLDSSTVVSDNYIVQKKAGEEWETLGEDTRDKMEYGSPNGFPIDETEYPQVGYETKEYEFIDDYGGLDKGKYRVIMGAKTQGKEYYLSIPFDITLEYEYLKEPTDYEYSVTTNWGQEEFIDIYKKCKDYVTYSELPRGIENSMFSFDMYKHLKKITWVSGSDKLDITKADKMQELYQYFAASVMTRTDEEVYGSTFFTDDDTLYYRTIPVPENIEQGEENYQVIFFFEYDGKTKKMDCQVSGHSMVVETTDFAFRDGISERFPMGGLYPVKRGKNMVMGFYVFNDIENVLEGMK